MQLSMIVKETKAYRLTVKKSLCAAPADLWHVEFVQEILNGTGDPDSVSTYEFFMSKEELHNVAAALNL